MAIIIDYKTAKKKMEKKRRREKLEWVVNLRDKFRKGISSSTGATLLTLLIIGSLFYYANSIDASYNSLHTSNVQYTSQDNFQ